MIHIIVGAVPLISPATEVSIPNSYIKNGACGIAWAEAGMSGSSANILYWKLFAIFSHNIFKQIKHSVSLIT